MTASAKYMTVRIHRPRQSLVISHRLAPELLFNLA
jgi:hypothetical protein